MKRILIVTTLALGLHLGAQSPLTLEDCIRIATERSLEVRRGQLAHDRSAVQLSSRQAAFLPTLSASAGQSIDLGRSPDKTGVMQDRSSLSVNLGINAQLTLFSGFARLNDLKAARLHHEATKYETDQARWDIRLQVAQYYYSLLHARGVEQVAQADLKRQESMHATAQAMCDAGRWSIDRLAEAEAQREAARLRVLEAQQAIATAHLDLMLTMEATGTPESQPIADVDLTQAILRGQEVMQSTQREYETSLEVQPRLQASSLALSATRYQISSARSGYMPTLSLSAGYGNSYYYLIGEQYHGMNLSWGEQWRQNGRSYVGLSLGIPIFDAWRTRNNIRMAKLELINLELQEAATRKQIRRDVEQARLAVVQRHARIEATRSSELASRRAQELVRERWEVGRATTSELAEANARQLSAELEHLNAQYDFVLRTELLRLMTEP